MQIERIYIDNFRCLSGFELRLEPLNLLLGRNGSGKTTLFHALARLRWLLVRRGNVDSCFRRNDLTAWSGSRIQTFEVDVRSAHGTYRYSLVIEQELEKSQARIAREVLTLDGMTRFEFAEGRAHYLHDSQQNWEDYPFSAHLSPLAYVDAREDNRLLTEFKQFFERLLILYPNPWAMDNSCTQADPFLLEDASNFAGWFQHIQLTEPSRASVINEKLRLVIPGFQKIFLLPVGDMHHTLLVEFDSQSPEADPVRLRFDELSNGQKMQVLLYALLHALPHSTVLLIDEPENFLALSEIQPWIMSLDDAVEEMLAQAILISHHPEIINFVSANDIVWFERPMPDAPAYAVRGAPHAADSALPLAELMARGWVD